MSRILLLASISPLALTPKLQEVLSAVISIETVGHWQHNSDQGNFRVIALNQLINIDHAWIQALLHEVAGFVDRLRSRVR